MFKEWIYTTRNK